MSNVLIFSLLLVMQQALSVTVNTPRGKIAGQKASDGNYTTFFGVPYARVDERNPFKDTLDYPNFDTPFNATDPFIKCPQVIITEGGILQCLRLNIYVPADVNNKNTLPIFVWFHGGGLAFGSAGEYNAKHLVQENIIVVTANYRLGPYGFLCTSDIKNQGLKDQKTALKWIKKNIQSFGGDPNRVTIGGESWGGSTVDFLLYAEADFSQAIMQSGSRYSFGVSTRQDNEAPIKLAGRLGYNTTKHKDAVNYLSTADPVEVMRITRDLGYVFGVCEKQGDFRLKKKYTNMIKNIPILVGYNSKETFADFVLQPSSFYANLRNELLNNLNKIFDLSNDVLINLADIIWTFYLGDKTISKDSMLEIMDLSSDLRVNYGVERSVTNYLKSENPKIYKYIFSYTGGSPYNNVSGVGAYHTEELPYLFDWGIPLKTEEQFNVRQWMVKTWANFVKYGDPTPAKGEMSWLPTNLATRPYLNIDVKLEMRTPVYNQRMAFWDLIWAAYGRYRK